MYGEEYIMTVEISKLQEKFGTDFILKPTVKRVPSGYKFNWNFQWKKNGDWGQFTRYISFNDDYDKMYCDYRIKLDEFIINEYNL